jgi:subtilisin family serine protease
MRFALKWILALSLAAAPIQADQRVIVRVLGGETTVRTACLLLGCNLLGGLGDPQSQLFLVSILDIVDLGGFLSRLSGLLGIVSAEPDRVILLNDTRPPIPAELYDPQQTTYFGATVRQGYIRQPAFQLLRISETQNTFSVAGSATVAVIDTGVDVNHPVLRPILLPGYDYTRGGIASASELGDVNQSTTAVVDGVPPLYVSDSAAAVLDQSTTAVVDDPDHKAFGHGTMVAGVIHLVAPRALILPLKAFRPDGSGYTSDILRAVYRATRERARVINMSFSLTASSSELRRAVEHATANGAICVASAGNQGQKIPVYPSAWTNVIGVASTTNQDGRSSFSNYGSEFVSLAAPGEGVITTYPFGTYAAAWGTSFSTPFVSGTVALLEDMRPDITASQAAAAISDAIPAGPDLGWGRLDIYRAAAKLRNLR